MVEVPPDRFARGLRHLVEVEPADDLVRRIACDVVLEDAPDHRRFGLVHNQVRRDGAGTGHAAIAVGGFPEDYFATAGTPEFAAPITLGDFSGLVYSAITRLGSVTGLADHHRASAHRKQHMHAMPFELVEHDHLICIHAG